MIRTEVEEGAVITMTAVLQSLTGELLKLAGTVAKPANKNRIEPRHIMMAVNMSAEFQSLLKGVIFPSSGGFPTFLDANVPVNLEEEE
jgi:hypothetical protein